MATIILVATHQEDPHIWRNMYIKPKSVMSPAGATDNHASQYNLCMDEISV